MANKPNRRNAMEFTLGAGSIHRSAVAYVLGADVFSGTQFEEPLCHVEVASGFGPELCRAEVDFDRNYDNYDECELRYRNFDNAISIGCKNTAALC